MEHDDKPPKSWFSNLKSHLLAEPESLDELLAILKTSVEKNILDRETLNMVEGLLAISTMQVRDVMTPRSQMVVLEKNQPPATLLDIVSNASHSRFPVIGEDKDDVLGIVLIKDCLKADLHGKEINLDTILRPAYFVPESKRLDTLLNEFRSSHNHLAIVVDEYGGIAGLISIEDILEEIVGDIEDEFDADNAEEWIKISDHHYHVYAALELEEINERLGTNFNDDEVDTIGGLLTRVLGHIPQVGESALIDHWQVTALKADSRKVLQVDMQQNAKAF